MDVHARVIEAIRSSGLVRSGDRVLPMLSGGADSVCLLHALREVLGEGSLIALHVNHGLRDAATDDERFCSTLCDRLGVRLAIERVELEDGPDLEARAREARYRMAEATRVREGLGLAAAGHTASDQVETVLYRLATSPGRRALLGMRPRNGHLVRPLLTVTAGETRAYCRAAGLDWREDESNLDRRFARNRVRLDVVPALREIHPAFERNLLSTVDQLREEAELLDLAVDDAAGRVGAGTAPGSSPAVDGQRLRELPPALRRLLLRRLAEQAAGGPLPLRGDQLHAIEQLGLRGGSASLDLAGGVRATSEYGVLRFQRARDAIPLEPCALSVPGHCRFGRWEVACELIKAGTGSLVAAGGSPDEALLDAALLAERLVVRPWRSGDRMRPLGLDGTKSLQDLFTDRKVPRALRHSLPVVESEGEIAWVAGVALSDSFKVTDTTSRAARLTAAAREDRPPREHRPPRG